MRKSGSEDDVFSAVGGMEMGRHDPSAAAQPSADRAANGSFGGRMPAAPLAQGSGEAAQFLRGNSGGVPGGAGPMIGDLPFSDTPSRTLVVRNIPAACSDAELQQAFEVCKVS